MLDPLCLHALRLRKSSSKKWHSSFPRTLNPKFVKPTGAYSNGPILHAPEKGSYFQTTSTHGCQTQTRKYSCRVKLTNSGSFPQNRGRTVAASSLFLEDGSLKCGQHFFHHFSAFQLAPADKDKSYFLVNGDAADHDMLRLSHIKNLLVVSPE